MTTNEPSMWSGSTTDYGMTSREADWTECSDPPEESCSDAACPRHGGGDTRIDYDEPGDD